MTKSHLFFSYPSSQVKNYRKKPKDGGIQPEIHPHTYLYVIWRYTQQEKKSKTIDMRQKQNNKRYLYIKLDKISFPTPN